MRTDELTQAWRDATEDLPMPENFVDRVVRGGARRALRRRVATIAAGVAPVLVATLVVAALGLTGSGADRQTAMDPRLSEPALGDLAGDQELLNDAVRVWQEGIEFSGNRDRGIFDDPRGEPHVYWAGTTPAGPAVVILQAFYLHPHDNLAEGDWDEMQTLVGLVGIDPGTGQLALLGDQYQPDHYEQPGAFRFGPEDRTVLVLERDATVYMSTHRAYTPEGRITRDWERLSFSHGVAIYQVPPDHEPADVRLLETTTPPAPTDRLDERQIKSMQVVVASLYRALADDHRSGGDMIAMPIPDRRLPWHDETCRTFGDSRPAIGLPGPFRHLWAWGAIEDGLGGVGEWCVAVGVDEGRTIVVGEVQENEGPSRLFALTTDTDGIVLGVQVGESIDPSAPLPVAIHLKNGEGWVVAAYGRDLAYRSTVDGDWTASGAGAALLPDDAIEVRLTGGGQDEVVVPLAG